MALLKDTLIQGSARVTDTLYANILKSTSLSSDILNISVDSSNAASTSIGINFVNSSGTIQAHIGSNNGTIAGIYSVSGLAFRPGSGSINSTEGFTLSPTAMLPKNATIALGGTSNRWNGVYSSTGNFNGAVSVDTLTITNTSAAVHLAFSRSSLPNYIGIPDNGTLIVSNNNVLDYPAAALAINKSAVYSGMKGTLGTSTYPWGKIYIKGYQYLYADNTRYPLDMVMCNGSGTQVAEMWYDIGNATNVTGGTYYWRQYSPKATPDTGTSGYYEQFQLPSVTAGRTSNSSTYTILTTKSTVTVSQGGTGATSFTANSLIMSGSTATAALTTRAIYDRTTVDALSALATWSNSTSIPTMNTLAYWDGRYQTTNNLSNLKYCAKGEFGTIITKSDTYYRVNTAPASGAWYAGTPLITDAGVMEIGKYIDFHDGNTSTADYNVRIYAESNNLAIVGDSNFSSVYTVGNIFSEKSIVAGQWTANTDQDYEYTIQLKGGAGTIYMYSQRSKTGNRGIYSANGAGTEAGILVIDTNNTLWLQQNTYFNNALAIEKTGNNTSWIKGRDSAVVRRHRTSDAHYVAAMSLIGTSYSWEIGQYQSDTLWWTCCPNSKYTSNTNEPQTQMSLTTAGRLTAPTVANAIWNDYAEYRKTNTEVKYGQVVIDNDDGSLSITTKRLQPGAQVISDTWGHIMGETEEAKTPVAVAGRVLVYTYQPRENYHAGMTVCSAPNGTVDIMSREEIKEYPDAIIGIVSEIPEYEEWGSGHVKVDNRIWIKVK